MNSNLRSRQEGFTLIEVLIVMAILVFISLGIYQTTSETFKLRDSLQNEGEFYNTIRMTMNILDRDIAEMYSPLLMIQNGSPGGTTGNAPGNTPNAVASPKPGGGTAETQISSVAAADLQIDGDFWTPAVDNTGLRPSKFVGKSDKITFISASHIRMYKDLPESDLVKITYEFKRDESPTPGVKLDDPMVLVKSENVNVFENDTFKDRSTSVVYPLLHGVTKYKFEFYDKVKLKWEREWDSEKVNNVYPDLVRVHIEVHGLSNLAYEGDYYFRPEAPLNGLNPSS